MANLITIYCIHASDAPQHLGKIQQFSQKLSEQKRIADFVPLAPEAANSSLSEKVQETDVIILLLTLGLGTKQKEIENLLSQLKTKLSNIIIAEIIIDNIQYENEYITLPTDLKPIRDRQDMDQAWLEVEKNLDDLIPKASPSSWKKYIKPIAAVIVIGLLIWLVPKLFKSSLDFSFSIIDLKSNQQYTDTAVCYVPCLVSFTSDAERDDSVHWDFGDSTSSLDLNPTHLFVNSGDHKITLSTEKTKKDVVKNLLVKAPPMAEFNADNDGCKAPCKIKFVNKSGQGKSFRWTFEGINKSSTEENPEMEYATPGKYNVSFAMLNEDNVSSDTIVKQVSIRGNDLPYAVFSYNNVGGVLRSTRIVQFHNQSTNATEYTWDFGDRSTSTDVSPRHTYPATGNYVVQLTAKQGNVTNSTSHNIRVGYGLTVNDFKAVEGRISDPQLKEVYRKSLDASAIKVREQ